MLRALPVLIALALLSAPAPCRAADPLPGVGYDRIVAVVVGISAQRAPWEPLPNATRDAERFAALLAGRDVAVIELYDEQATEDAIIEAITEQAPAALGDGTTSKHRNLLIVYFVGHGHTVGDDAREEGFVVPYGATSRADWISMRDLNGLHTLSGPFRHQLFVLASCFGGELLRDGSPVPPKTRMKQLARNDAASRWLARGLSKVARVGLTAGGEGQKVPDGPEGHGSPFGNALINALQAAGGSKFMAADFNTDGCVSSLELAAYVEGKGRTDHNVPRAGTLDGDDQGTVALCGQRFAKAPPLKTVGVRFRGTVPEGFVAVPASSVPTDVKPQVQITCKSIELGDQVFFETGKFVIQERSFGLLDNIAKTLIDNPQIRKVRIEGHTDNQGDPAANEKLSSQRVWVVREYLAEKGVDKGRLAYRGYGQTKPIASNDTEDGRAKNDRVEITIIDADKREGCE